MTDLTFDEIRLVLDFLCQMACAEDSHLVNLDDERAERKRRSIQDIIRPILFINRNWNLPAQIRAVRHVRIWRSWQARAFVLMIIKKPLVARSVLHIVLGSQAATSEESDGMDLDLLTVSML